MTQKLERHRLIDQKKVPASHTWWLAACLCIYLYIFQFLTVGKSKQAVWRRHFGLWEVVMRPYSLVFKHFIKLSINRENKRSNCVRIAHIWMSPCNEVSIWSSVRLVRLNLRWTIKFFLTLSHKVKLWKGKTATNKHQHQHVTPPAQYKTQLQEA